MSRVRPIKRKNFSKDITNNSTINNKDIKISIIIPVYNCADYIAECLDSIINQTLRDIEIICINDVSSDNSLGIIEEYRQRDPRIVVKTLKENSGAAIARNTALSIANGEYIAFMDADDSYPSNDVLEYLYSTARNNDVVICGGSFSSLKNGEIITEYSGLNSAYVFDKEGFVDFKDYQFEFGYQRFIFNRKFIEENKFRFPNYRRFQDPPFFVSAMIKARKFYAVSKIVYQYREDYKKINWTPEKAMDLLKGVTDLLNISSINNLNLLHYRTFERLCSYTDIFWEVYKKDPDYCIPFFIAASRAIDIPVVRFFNKSVDEHYTFPALDLAVHLSIKGTSVNVPKVSVVIPIYNVQEYIVECLASVLNQTLKDIEIICVDDESPDNSIEIILKEFGEDPRIKIVRKKNGGLSSARNAGANVATGEYIYFLDSDDYIDKDAFEILYNESKKNELDILIFDADSFSDERFIGHDDKAFMDKKVQNYLEYYHRKGDYSEIVEGQVLFLRMKAKNEHRSAVWLQFINRNYYVEKRLDSYNGILHEDNLFTLKSMLQAKRVKHIPCNFYHRRVRLGSIMTEKEGVKNLKGYFITYCEALKFLLRMDKMLYPPVRKAYLSEMNNYIRCVRRISKIVPEEELNNFISELTDFERVIYDYVISVGKTEKYIGDLTVSFDKVKNKINEMVNVLNAGDSGNKISAMTGYNAHQKGRDDKNLVVAEKLRVSPIGKIKGLFRCLREHGFVYTVIRILRGKRKAVEFEIRKSNKK